MELLKDYQLNIMLLLSGICATIAFFVIITKTIKPQRKKALLSMEIGAMVLLIADRYAYVYRGVTTTLGIFMTRISNYAVFFLMLFLLFSFNNYLKDMFCELSPDKSLPLRLRIVDLLFSIGEVFLVISQFTGIYYTFDDQNRYQRADGFIICYMMPIIIILFQLSVIVQYFERLTRGVRLAMLLFTVVPLIASIAQIFVYGLSLTSISIVGMVVLLYIYTLMDSNAAVEHAKNLEIKVLKEEQEHFRLIFGQTAEALASAIDAKDKYTHGHSRRVAEYSHKIARIAGLDNKECEEVYFAALLHDVGKIGIPDSIINKEGKLTDEEFAAIKKHPVIGKQILSSISRSPYLSIGANYHHERYDGRGYPEGLKGEDIPNIARIIAVADAYDAMTSKRSYRDPIPQQLVREEFVKGIETQFDPVYAKIMLHLIDLDSEYRMKELGDIGEFAGMKEIHLETYRSDFTDGIHITEFPTNIHIHSKGGNGALSADPIPSMIIFDSLDARVHDNNPKTKDLLYFEYCEIRADGQVLITGAREFNSTVSDKFAQKNIDWKEFCNEGIDLDIESVRWKDHIRMRINCEYRSVEFIIALPDSTRFAYISFTGHDCIISRIKVSKSDTAIKENDIPRIAEEISYINVPAGDVPNVQIDGWRTDATKGIPITGTVRLTFHTMSLPTARLVWHCPFAVIFSSDDQLVTGENYREFALIRMDGESWETDKLAKNKILVNKGSGFDGWDMWKKNNKSGLDCTITVSRMGNIITVLTESGGISTHNVTTINDDIQNICIALTGDQCALTNIRIEALKDTVSPAMSHNAV